jgi:hypothetical protein
MRKMLPVGALSSFCVMAVLWGPVPCRSQDHAVNAGIRDRFIGAWRLAWLEEPGADGKVHRVECTGLLVYTRDGHMSVQVMYRNPQAATHPGQVQYAQRGIRGLLRHVRGRRTHSHFYFSRRRRAGADANRQRPAARIPVFGKPANREVGEPERTLGSGLGTLLSNCDLRKPYGVEMDDRIFQKEEEA